MQDKREERLKVRAEKREGEGERKGGGRRKGHGRLKGRGKGGKKER